MNGGVKQGTGLSFSVYFMAVLFVAVLFPAFSPLMEWILPPLFIFPMTAVRIGTPLLLIVALVVILHPLISVPILGIIYAIDVHILGRFLRTVTGGRPVFFLSIKSFLKFYVRFVIFVYFYSVIMLSLFFGLSNHAAILLFAMSLLIIVMSHVERWRNVLFQPGWKPVRKVWPLVAAIALIVGLCIIFETPRNLPLLILGVVCLTAALIVTLRRKKNDMHDSTGSLFLNTNAMALLAFFVSAIVLFNQFWLSPRRVPVMGSVREILNEGTVYDVMPDEEDGSVFFTTLDDNKTVGKKQRNGKVIWTKYKKLKHMERIQDIRSMNAIAVFGHSGFHLFSKKNLKMIKQISENRFVDTEVAPDGSMIYGVREYDNYLYLISPEFGTLRTYRMGPRILCPYAILRIEPSTLFVSNWFTSPILVKIDLKHDDISFTYKLVGFFTTGMAADKKRNRLYISRFLFNRIDILDMDTLEVVGKIATKANTRQIVFDEKRDMLIAPDYYTGLVTVVDIPRKNLYVLPSIGSEIRSLNLDATGEVLYFGNNKGVYALDWGVRWKKLLEDAEREGSKYRIE